MKKKGEKAIIAVARKMAVMMGFVAQFAQSSIAA